VGGLGEETESEGSSQGGGIKDGADSPRKNNNLAGPLGAQGGGGDGGGGGLAKLSGGDQGHGGEGGGGAPVGGGSIGQGTGSNQATIGYTLDEKAVLERLAAEQAAREKAAAEQAAREKAAAEQAAREQQAAAEQAAREKAAAEEAQTGSLGVASTQPAQPAGGDPNTICSKDKNCTLFWTKQGTNFINVDKCPSGYLRIVIDAPQAGHATCLQAFGSGSNKAEIYEKTTAADIPYWQVRAFVPWKPVKISDCKGMAVDRYTSGPLAGYMKCKNGLNP
jgi:hypothetical protein